MTGEALTNACALSYHEQCQNDIVGYKGAHIQCTCECHKKKGES